MIDFLFVVVLAVVATGAGRLILDRLGQAPEHPLDSIALALPLGLGGLSLATLFLGELGRLDRIGLALAIGAGVELALCWVLAFVRQRGTRPRNGALHVQAGGAPECQPTADGKWRLQSFRMGFSEPGPCVNGSDTSRGFSAIDMLLALFAVAALLATALSALAPVTDGDALCYHLQVPKVFLMHGTIGYAPDLHETVYPLVTELLYALALEFRGPVACRWIQWILGLVFAANVTALARPSLGRRAWWAGAIVLLVPAVSSGMSAPLNDVALGAFGIAAILAWTRLHRQPSLRSAMVAGAFAGLAIGVKYPALVLCGLLLCSVVLRCFWRGSAESAIARVRWPALAGLYLAVTILVGGCWYLRAYVHTGNPVFPFFRSLFGGAGLNEVLGVEKRPLAPTVWNLIGALVPMSLTPDRFDSFSHQFGPVFLLCLPALFVERVPRRILALVGLGYLFLALCLTQRQSMRFVLVALGPMSIGVAYLAHRWSQRNTVPARLLVAVLLVALGFEASLAIARSRHALGFVVGRESSAQYLTRREPSFNVGRWADEHLPKEARLIGQDHRGFYIPRDYTMELSHRRRTGLGKNGESVGEIIRNLREAGFTHLLLCPPVPESAVEFDPTLGRLLSGWLARRTPLFRRDLVDGDGVLRRYSIYEIAPSKLATRPEPEVTR
jgi:hypothetical protein